MESIFNKKKFRLKAREPGGTMYLDRVSLNDMKIFTQKRKKIDPDFCASPSICVLIEMALVLPFNLNKDFKGKIICVDVGRIDE